MLVKLRILTLSLCLRRPQHLDTHKLCVAK